MSQKFLSDVTLSTVTGGSMLKLDANGKIVAAVDGTDYISTSASSLWSTASGGIFYSDDVRVGTYQSDVAPDAKLHVYDYQTTTPKLLIEDGNTGDASMEFKISTQSFTMGIDNSDSDKFVIAASGGLGTSNVLEIATSGLSAFQNSVLVKGSLFINNQEQIQQGATEKIASFQNLGTERGYFEVTDTGKGYFYADGFKTGATTVGFLKSDGSVDTGSFFSGNYSDLSGTPTLGTMAAANTNDYKTSDEVETYVAGELVYTNISGTPTLGTAAAADTTDFATAAQGALADSALQSLPSHNHDGRYYTETEADSRFAQNGNNLVPINATDSHYQLFTEEVILATVNTYRGLAFPNGGKNFVFEVSIKGTNGANHQGIFWGLDTLESIYNNGEAGYKLTHQGEGQFHIRDIASNANQATSQDVMYAPNDGLYHRYKIISYVDPSNSNKAFFKVYVDGNLIFNAPQFAAPPQVPTYFGFINYTGEATFSNWNVREITGEAELALLYGDGVFQPAGNYLTSLPAHHHDARYYTETEMDTFLAGKLSTSGGVLSGALNVLYTDSPTGTGWDKNLFIGTSDDLGLAGAFPTYVPSGSYGFFSHANSDGVFIGSVPTAAGSSNYYATIAWGDDSTEYLQFLYKGTQVAYLETSGNLYIDGSFYSGTSKIATETFASGEAQAVQDNLDTVVGSLGSNAYTSYTDHTGLYDTVGSAAAEAGAVQDNLDSLATSLGTAAFTASTDYQAAGNYADGTTYQTYGTGNNGWLMPDYNNNTSNFMRMYYDDGSREFRMYSNHGAASGEAKIALYDGGVFNTLSSTNIAEFKTAYGWGNHASAGYATTTALNNGLAGKADTSHKYHSFSNGQQYYDSYAQGNYLRMFTETATFDTFRFRGYRDVETSPDGTQWNPQPDLNLDALFDGREDTGISLTHEFSKFRFEIDRSSGWPTTALFVMQSSWTNTSGYTCDVILETWNGSAWVVKDSWSYSNYERGINLHTTTQTHDGIQKMRVTILMDWNDASHNYHALRRIMFLSNFSGGETLQPYTWNYNRVINFDALPQAGGADLATQSWVSSQGYITSVPSEYLTQTEGDARYLQSVPAEYLTQTEGDARYLQSLPAHNHDTLYDSLGSADAVATALNERIDTEVFNAIATVDGNIPTNNNQLTNGAGYATTSYVNTAVSNLVDTAPATLNTLNELAAALGDDPNFATTVTNSIAGKLSTSGGTLTGSLTLDGGSNLNLSTSGTDVGDIVWNDLNGELHRLWDGGANHLNYRYKGGTSYKVWTAYDFSASSFDAAGSAAAVATTLNERIDTEVFDAISAAQSTADGAVAKGVGYMWTATGSNALSFRSQNTIESSAGDQAALEVFQDNAGEDAFMQFHVSSDYAVYFGLDGSTNDLAVGGWSMGANKYKIWHAGNDGSGSGLDADTVDGLHESTFMRRSANSNLAMNNYNITGVNHITINDSGFGEGIGWQNWLISDCPDDLSNAAGNLQISSTADPSIRVTVDPNGNLYPSRDRLHALGLETNRWQIVFCEILDSAGQHEKNLQNPEGEKSVGEYETGTVLVWKGGKNVPCTTAADHMRMGIAVKGIDSPLIQGAEPVLVTGAVKEGDYLVTSSKKEGHAEAISPEFMRQHNLFDCVLGKALESAEGESHLVKTWINI